MANISKQDDEIRKAQSQAATRSLKDRIHSLKARLKNNLLIDISGSMADEDGEGNSKHSIMQGIVSRLPEGIRKFAFNSNCRELDSVIPEPAGGTNMAGAFSYVKSQGIKEVILITDGQPDSPRDALAEAIGLTINIVYIGPKPEPQFLKDLARQANGTFVDIDMLEAGSANQLENKIQLLLGA